MFLSGEDRGLGLLLALSCSLFLCRPQPTRYLKSWNKFTFHKNLFVEWLYKLTTFSKDLVFCSPGNAKSLFCCEELVGSSWFLRSQLKAVDGWAFAAAAKLLRKSSSSADWRLRPADEEDRLLLERKHCVDHLVKVQENRTRNTVYTKSTNAN